MVINVKQKLAGILVPVFALRHERDFGIGDTIAFEDTIEFCRRHHIGALQTLPINETGGDNSPYNAISSVALDPALIAMVPDKVPGLKQEHLRQLTPEHRLAHLRQGPVNYREVKRLKQELLRAAFTCFEQEKSEKAAISLKQFENEHCLWLPAYTLFRTLIDVNKGNTNWTEWCQEMASFKTAESWIKSSPQCESLLQTRRFWTYVQWVAFNQWDSVKKKADNACVKLIGDIPFGISRFSADVWSQTHLFDLHWSCGAPPELHFQGDRFTQKWGQNWGMPLYNWAEHKQDGFSWWRQRVRQVTRFFHCFRIDHVLGFFRVYAFPWFPEQNADFLELSLDEVSTATGGRLPQFLPNPDEPTEWAKLNCDNGEAILRILKEAAGLSDIIAEDLGVVPSYVRPLLRRLGMAGFSVPMFERNDMDRSYKPGKSLPELSLATYGTHDHLPLVFFYRNLVDWWHGPNGHDGWLEIQRLMRFLELDENSPPQSFNWDLHKAFLRSLLSTPCWLAVFTITDLFGTQERFNEPGLSSDYNWSQRLDRPINDYNPDPAFAYKLSFFVDLIKLTNRDPYLTANLDKQNKQNPISLASEGENQSKAK